MIIWLLLAMVCNGPELSSCHFLEHSLPVTFRDADSCMAFTDQAAEQGATYGCQEGVLL